MEDTKRIRMEGLLRAASEGDLKALRAISWHYRRTIMQVANSPSFRAVLGEQEARVRAVQAFLNYVLGRRYHNFNQVSKSLKHHLKDVLLAAASKNGRDPTAVRGGFEESGLLGTDCGEEWDKKSVCQSFASGRSGLEQVAYERLMLSRHRFLVQRLRESSEKFAVKGED